MAAGPHPPVHSLFLSFISYIKLCSKQSILGQTQAWFRDLPFSLRECGVHDTLKGYTFITPCVGSFTSPGTDTRYKGLIVSKTQAMWGKQTCSCFEPVLQPLHYCAPFEIQSLMLRGRLLHGTHRNTWSEDQTPNDHYTTVPLSRYVSYDSALMR